MLTRRRLCPTSRSVRLAASRLTKRLTSACFSTSDQSNQVVGEFNPRGGAREQAEVDAPLDDGGAHGIASANALGGGTREGTALDMLGDRHDPAPFCSRYRAPG